MGIAKIKVIRYEESRFRAGLIRQITGVLPGWPTGATTYGECNLDINYDGNDAQPGGALRFFFFNEKVTEWRRGGLKSVSLSKQQRLCVLGCVPPKWLKSVAVKSVAVKSSVRACLKSVAAGNLLREVRTKTSQGALIVEGMGEKNLTRIYIFGLF